jgi:hypothetical protein
MAQITTRQLVMTLDGADVTAQISTCIVKTAETDSDFVSFADAAAGGGRDYKLALTFVQDPAADTVWDQVWSHAGEEVPVIIKPFGNAVATAGQPHFTATAVISEPDGDLLGGEADASPSNRFTTEVEWALTGKPVKVVA